MTQYNPLNDTEMNVCFVDPSISNVGVVGIGSDASEALFDAICNAGNNCIRESQVGAWVEDLDQYYITDAAYNKIMENGTANCYFSDDFSNVVCLRGE